MTNIQILYDGPIVNRADAKCGGLTRYFTGKPCNRGHVDQRMSANSGCVTCHREWSKKYRNENPDYPKEYYYNNRERYAEHNRRWRKENPERAAERSKKWWAENPEKMLEKSKLYRKNNPEKSLISGRTRRARKQNADGSHTADDVFKMLDVQKYKCAEPTCQADLSDGYHVDHIIPLSKGGGNGPDNLQCLCPSCNLRKSSKLPHEWAREMGRLL